MRSFFIIFDRDLDCVVNKSDFVDWVEERAKKYMSKEKAEVFCNLWDKEWDMFCGGAQKEKENINEMVKAHQKYLQDPHYHEKTEKWLSACFDGVDANSDGMVTMDEYAVFLECFGVHPLSVCPSFEALDANHDGLISREEFVNAGRDFFQHTDDTPAKLFWGPFLA
ncbi:sarcoplasmic calcium-binding protein [Lingula anatina]|uniref:Sarcoplasmic calcium-binding protein n=1 Tax=Lingula anatina TaxID=7574 RepID=A0A1S3ID72_LINAN|nr:sarcoplasmic calcium-binding protein [Lingula anatina]|eukprot:XP_013396187.1 sarcoplasmic calcium-binding protein [Lingula anatina]